MQDIVSSSFVRLPAAEANVDTHNSVGLPSTKSLEYCQ